MYFSNLFNARVRDERKCGRGTIPFVCDSDILTVEDAHVVCNDGMLLVKTGAEALKDDIFMQGLISEDPEELILGKQYKLDLRYKDIQETAENPLIVVLAKSIKLYAGVTTYIKYITMDDCILAMLVFGACEFTFPDGTSVPMQRCNNSLNLVNRQTVEYDAKSIAGLSRLEDEESNYLMINDVVNAVVVSFSSSRGTTFDGVRYKTMKNHVKVFNTKNVLDAREKERKRKERAELLKLQKIEERKKAELREKQLKKDEEQKVLDEQFSGINQGALAFLNAVNNN